MKNFFNYYGTLIRSISTLLITTILILMLVLMLACTNNANNSPESNNSNNANNATEPKTYPSKGEPADQLIAVFMQLHHTALNNDLATIEALLDTKYIDKQKALSTTAKINLDWSQRVIKLFASEPGDIFNYEFADAKQAGEWARLELVTKDSKFFQKPAFYFLIFHRVNGQWKLYESVFAQKENFATPIEYIKEKVALPLFIPPVTEVPADSYKRMLIDKVIAAGAELNGQFIEVEGIMAPQDKTNWFLTANGTDHPILTLNVRQEYIANADKVMNQCGKKCRAVVRGVVSLNVKNLKDTNNIYLTQVTVLGPVQ